MVDFMVNIVKMIDGWQGAHRGMGGCQRECNTCKDLVKIFVLTGCFFFSLCIFQVRG